MKQHRLARVSEVIREVASETILFEMKDPRVKNVTVTRAEVAADLQHAKIYVSVMGSPKEQDLCMHGLRNAAGFVQAKLGNRLKTRFTPVVRFVLDLGIKNSIEISRLINEALGKGSADTPVPMDEQVKLEDEAAPRRIMPSRDPTRGIALADGTAVEENVNGILVKE